ncbi:UDP-N-acetylmuramoylalanine--D-glutamate ligase [Planktothrix tepida]|uniref:UDP-N-acetylmuramoylalanine--D-glutamate ligase n=1 Tax=Planktothrix tepida PCC 9214 TaxID=671072 RepID=A0A1J1LRN9_9CYAN|nr:UDP-N-acetylmuramoyl-L-alanine--D-glutamate ligase [Planktothrix tepida]CAD5969575.1 UDP-N-acetylmuramoylalanine--D-glutamate ligase [Planktothrix tepida]CUR35267.1 UDP-N-acetylmuramoylalanine--D-glutamate ligase [Planktothrix tepida PCC 9214]
MLKAHVIGLGKSGNAAARLLKLQGWDVSLSDRNNSSQLEPQKQQLESEGIVVNLGENFQPDESLDLVVVSPGVPWDIPGLKTARNLGIETIGEMELAWRNLRDVPWVCITGTNGKTTTTALTAAIFQVAGLNAPACGNIGYAACELALQEYEGSAQPLDWIIAEVSSYQIESSSTLNPRIAVWTTFTPDHLNRHYTLERYYDIKAKLLYQSQQQVINGDDPYLRETAHQRWLSACWTSVLGQEKLVANSELGFYIENNWVMQNGEPIVQADALKMVGSHNQQNLLMAVATARLAGIETEAICHAISNFPGVAHRLEQIMTWQGIDWINDSKATNYDAAEVGLAAVDSPVILIAGGEAKKGDDTAWIYRIKEKVASVLLIGDAAEAFSQRLKAENYFNFEIVETLEKAIQKASEIAPKLGAKVVLLSPACASFDQYQSFEHRGEHFRQLCLELKG